MQAASRAARAPVEGREALARHGTSVASSSQVKLQKYGVQPHMGVCGLNHPGRDSGAHTRSVESPSTRSRTIASTTHIDRGADGAGSASSG